MAPPRKHETDAILDATRALVLTAGPRAASVAAIAKASGAPAGTPVPVDPTGDVVTLIRP